jgi:4-hydroxy-tetrahydrodipicolinate synthase
MLARNQQRVETCLRRFLRFSDLKARLNENGADGEGFIQLSGNDETALAFNAHGGIGCISVTANVAPRLCAEFQAATLAGDYKKALAYQDRLFPLHEAIFLEPGLAGAKYGLSLLGKCSEDVRLPLVTLTDGTKARIKAAMQHAGLI